MHGNTAARPWRLIESLNTVPTSVSDGVSSLLPRERMSLSARKLRDTYARKPDAPFFQREFGFFCLERWKEQGMPQDVPMEKLFGYDPPGNHRLGGLGWCEAAFSPAFEERVLEDRGEHEWRRTSPAGMSCTSRAGATGSCRSTSPTR